MKLKNILIVVKDIEVSKTFYRDLFGMHIVADFGGNAVLTEGLVLQEQSQWEEALGRGVREGGNDAELYFEEYDLDVFLAKVENSGYKTEFVTKPGMKEDSKRVVRLYDPDKHMIEVAEVRTEGDL